MPMRTTERLGGETARAYAYRTLRDNIISLELAPGSPLSDIEVSAAIGVSRTPVREAIIQLSEESHIIEIFPQRGMRISLIDVELVEEARFLRLLLEKAVAALSCERACEEDLRWLRENVRLQEFYMEAGEPDALLRLDNEMHRRLFSICRKELTFKLCERLSIHYDRIRSLSVNSEKDRRILEDHRALIEAIAARDPDGAAAVMERHLNRWKLDEARFRRQYPDYFKNAP